MFLITGLLFLLFLAGSYYLYHTVQFFQAIAPESTQTDTVSAYVLTENEAETIYETEGYVFGILETIDRDNTDLALEELRELTGFDWAVLEYQDYYSLTDALYEGVIEVMILNDAYLSLLSDTEGYETIEEDLRILLTTEQEQETVVVEKEPTEDDFFILYISGIDTTGKVSKKSRSDVNILAAVNTTTKEVLLISTPRDYYVELSISNGVRDKLTHAGIYGIQVSMDTLSMLYDVDINYYVRMNFTGFTEIIDALGGVEVYSAYAFSAGEYEYQVGYNEMDGAKALVFARERHSFSDGDNQRGKNQMEVIKAVIKKACSSTILTRYAEVMSSVADAFETNVPAEKIASIVAAQLTSGTGWNVTSFSVTGTNSSSTTTYSSSGHRVYVMEPDLDSVEEAKALLEKVRNGESLSEE